MNNSKKYLAVASGVLILLMVVISILQNLFSARGLRSSPTPSPTLNHSRYSGSRGTNSGANGTGQNSSYGESVAPTQIPKKIIQMQQAATHLPVSTDDFIAKHSPNLNKIVVTRKNAGGDGAFNDWAIDNGYPLIVNNPETTIYSDKSMEEVQTPYISQSPMEKINAMIDLASIVLKPGSLSLPAVTATPAPSPQSSSSSSSSSTNIPKTYDGYTYYSQCHGPYDNYPLASGCTVCDAGCGPTTVAMILSTYVDPKYDPPAVVDIYKSAGGAACGTAMYVAKNVLNSHGVQTSDYIIPWKAGVDYTINEVKEDLKAYLDNGWTIMVLAYYREGQGGGHYFWLTDIDEDGNAMAFDPYYGMDQSAPISENVRYPMPKYAAAFGVKKK